MCLNYLCAHLLELVSRHSRLCVPLEPGIMLLVVPPALTFQLLEKDSIETAGSNGLNGWQNHSMEAETLLMAPICMIPP